MQGKGSPTLVEVRCELPPYIAAWHGHQLMREWPTGIFNNHWFKYSQLFQKQDKARQGRRTGQGQARRPWPCRIGSHFPGFKKSGERGGASSWGHQKLLVAQLGRQRRLDDDIATPNAFRWVLKSFSPQSLPGQMAYSRSVYKGLESPS